MAVRIPGLKKRFYAWEWKVGPRNVTLQGDGVLVIDEHATQRKVRSFYQGLERDTRAVIVAWIRFRRSLG
jgi:hypothetical protein